MNKLLKLGFSLLDYEGKLKEFERNGEGIQFWGKYCSVTTEWERNRIKNKVEIDFMNFPMKILIDSATEKITDSLFKIDTLEINGKLNMNFEIKSGILKCSESDLEIHFVIKNNKLDIFQVFKSGEELEKQSYFENDYNTYRFYFDVQRCTYFEVDLTKNIINHVKMNKERQKEGHQHEFNFKENSITQYHYENNIMKKEQKTLKMSENIPFTKTWYNDERYKADMYYFADGAVLRCENDTKNGRLSLPGTNSYLTGKVLNDSISGACEIILDGKYTLKAESQNGKIFLKNPTEFLKVFEEFKSQNLGELEQGKLNGFQKYEYKNGISYTGYFLNDFIYCHKDSLLGCLRGLEDKNFPDLEEFFLKIKRFEGVLYNGKVQGKAKILYKNGDIYEGALDDYFNKTGVGQNLQHNGKLYSGDFKKDLYHGLGKLFENKNDFILGFFENGKLKLKFDLDNLDYNLYNQIQNQLIKEGDALQAGLLERVMKLEDIPTESQIMKTDKQQEDELLHSFTQNLNDQQKKRKEEQQKILDDLSREVAVTTIFHFTNGYVYHGKVKGDYIVDGDEGDIINLEGERIPVKYKYVDTIQLGTFKSKDARHIFMFKLSVKKLAHIVIDENYVDQNVQPKEDLDKVFDDSFKFQSIDQPPTNNLDIIDEENDSEDNVFK